MVLSVELRFDLKIECFGNWERRYEFVFTVLRIRGIVSRNVFKQPRKFVIQSDSENKRGSKSHLYALCKIK